MQIRFANPVHAIIASYANIAMQGGTACPTLDQYSGSASLCDWILTVDRNASVAPSDCIADLWATVTSILMDGAA